MPTNTGQGGAAPIRDTKDERYVKPCIPPAIVITSYRDLLACNGNLELGPRVEGILPDEDTWSTVVNIDESNQDTDRHWELAMSNKRSR